MKAREFVERCAVFVTGLFVMALGIAFTLHADLGITPISCPPYVLSLGLRPTVGQFTIAMHVVFVLLQLAILRKDFPAVQFLQVGGRVCFWLFHRLGGVAHWVVRAGELCGEAVLRRFGFRRRGGGHNPAGVAQAYFLRRRGVDACHLEASGQAFREGEGGFRLHAFGHKPCVLARLVRGNPGSSRGNGRFGPSCRLFCRQGAVARGRIVPLARPSPTGRRVAGGVHGGHDSPGVRQWRP